MIENYRGLKLIQGDLISQWVKDTGRLDHDQNTLPRILEHIHLGDVVVDVGAFIGDHTVAYAAAVGPGGFVHAVEPDREAFECLLHNTSHFTNIQLFNMAVGAGRYAGTTLPAGELLNKGASYITPDPKGAEKLRALDDVPVLRPRVNLIKLDVEGWEVSALKGARRLIEKHQPTLIVEVNEEALARLGHTPKDLFQVLKELRYNVDNIYKDQSLAGPQFDVVAVPKYRPNTIETLS